MEDFEIFDSPSLIWQGMSESEIDKEIQRLRSRRKIIDQFIKHLRTSETCDYSKYEQFCDLMITEGVNPNLWIDGVVETINYVIEEVIENANC